MLKKMNKKKDKNIWKIPGEQRISVMRSRKKSVNK